MPAGIAADHAVVSLARHSKLGQPMPRKASKEPDPPEVRPLTRSEIDRGISKLRRRIQDISALDPSEVRFDDATVANVKSDVRETIRDIFGSNSPEFLQHQRFSIWHGGMNPYDGDRERQQKFARGIPQAVTKLEGLISRLEERREDAPEDSPPPRGVPAPVLGNRRVFVVHGRDDAAKEMVARFLEKLELEAVILHEKPNQGRTIIEKFEGHAEVDFAVVLLTPDDSGHPANMPAAAKPRARQNVIFELGYFIGRIGRDRVCALYKSGVELPSDFDGVVYISVDDRGWRLDLAREIKAAGVEVDLNAAM